MRLPRMSWLGTGIAAILNAFVPPGTALMPPPMKSSGARQRATTTCTFDAPMEMGLLPPGVLEQVQLLLKHHEVKFVERPSPPAKLTPLA